MIMRKTYLLESLSFDNNEAAISFLFNNLNPLSQELIAAAKTSSSYKETISYLNTLPKDLDIEVYIGLSGRNLNRTIMLLGEEVKEIVQDFFKEMTSNLSYLYEDRIISNIPLFKEIQIENIKVGDVPSIQNDLSIFHKITLILPPELPEGGEREGFKPYSIYGNQTIQEAYNILMSKVSQKKEQEDNAQEQEIAALDQEDRVSNMPFDKRMEFLNLSDKPLDLSGPFLLKWSS